MKREKAVWLLSSTIPLVATVFSFSPLPTLRSSTRSLTSNTKEGAADISSVQRFMFGGGNPIDMMSSMFSASSKTFEVEPVHTALEAMSIPAWSQVRSHLESKMVTDEEKQFRANVEKGYGSVGSPLHKIRLFDESNKEEDIRVTFYRDSASWCPYCQKVWITLEEKKIPYRVEKINMRCYGEKPDSFKRLQPGGQIPVMTIDGKTLRQSNDILFALDDLFPKHKAMLPSDDEMKEKTQRFLRLERQLFSAWMYWLTQGGASSKKAFLETLDEVEEVLKEVKDGPFFLGKDISIVDIQYTPFLERMAASLLYYKGFKMRVVPGETTRYPNINKWFDTMETLPSYQLTKSDYYTHCWDLPPQLGGCVSEKEGKVFEEIINGMKSADGRPQGSWELPLQPHNGGVEPDWTWTGDDALSRREAVERLSANADAIVRFAARGAGSKGFPSYGAALSDPNAVPSDDIQPTVDYVLRLVCMSLLDGTESHQVGMDEMASALVSKGGKDIPKAVIASLSYLRDRVGVPRDMTLPAARQLRAHLNWAIGAILDKS